jgi:prolipoprotein diacylglyceryltransferase
MFPILQLGPLALRLPGLFLLAGVWVSTWLIDREAPRRRLSANVLNNMVLYGLVAGIAGARLWYAGRYLSVYLQDPLGLISLNPSTLAPWEGAVTGLVVSLVYGRRKSLPVWRTLDALTPAIAAFAVAIGLAHLSSGDAFGAPSSVAWAVELWGELRHPSQIYEILVGLLILLLIWRVRVRPAFPGFAFLAWVGLSAAGRLFLEAFRGDSVIIYGGLRIAQLVSLAVLLAALWGLGTLARGADVQSGVGASAPATEA